MGLPKLKVVLAALSLSTKVVYRLTPAASFLLVGRFSFDQFGDACSKVARAASAVSNAVSYDGKSTIAAKTGLRGSSSTISLRVGIRVSLSSSPLLLSLEIFSSAHDGT